MTDDLQDPATRLRIIQRFGSHSLAYSMLQPGMRYWGSASRGLAAYRKNLGQCTFLGDPACAPEMMDSFLAELLTAFPRALFMQIHAGTAASLRNLGHHITPVGVENDIDTATFTLRGRRMADLRHYRNKARAGKVVVEEQPDSAALRRALRPVSNAWLPQKSWIGRELEFLARPFTADPEPGVRIFTGSIEGKLVAFVVLDPLYRDERITGFSVTILRHYRDTPEGTVDSIVLEAIATLAAEGVPLLSLGVSPFHRLEELGAVHGVGSPAIFALYRLLRRWGNPIYHFRGLSFHKSRYRALETPVFTASPGPIGLWPLYASARACRML